MEKYYIIDSHGSSLFLQPYPKDFCIHCLVLLLDARPQETFSLLSASFELHLRREKNGSDLGTPVSLPAKETAHVI